MHAQRLCELGLSRRKTRKPVEAGAHEIGARHYPLIVSVP
jgi:isoprenylcysteine carboxyl methyltransferase (ICMT) family protein YpbQ